MAQRKTIDTWHVQLKYGHGWETLAVALTLADAVELQRQARKAHPYPVRSTKRRVRRSSLPPDELQKLEAEQKARCTANERDREDRRKSTFKER